MQGLEGHQSPQAPLRSWRGLNFPIRLGDPQVPCSEETPVCLQCGFVHGGVTAEQPCRSCPRRLQHPRWGPSDAPRVQAVLLPHEKKAMSET